MNRSRLVLSSLSFCKTRTLRTVNLAQVSMMKYSSITHIELESPWAKLKQKFGMPAKLKFPKRKLMSSGYNMYVCCQNLIDHEQMINDLELPDTFNSWFLLTDLHVWLCMVRLSQLGPEGRLLRNGMVTSMWTDVDSRSQHFGTISAVPSRKKAIQEFANIFYGSLFAYDEGLLGTDRELAAALWRQLFEMDDKSPQLLSLMVEYVRKQALHLDYQNTDLILNKGIITFLPLHDDKLNTEFVNKKLLPLFNTKVVS